MTDKPTVLIIGGLGYIGRFLTKYILDNSLASDIRLVDKTVPQAAYLAPEFDECLKRCTFVQAEASRENVMPRVFDRADGKAFDYVFNCGGETRYGQVDELYRLRTLALSSMCGREAAKRGVRVFIELSTGMVYKESSKACVESDEKKPWNRVSQYKLQAEEELTKIKGLPYVYGPYMTQWMGLAIGMANLFKGTDGDMGWLFSRDLRTNTVHINDTVRAIWTTAEWYCSRNSAWDAASLGTPVPTFNIVGQGNTTKAELASILRLIYLTHRLTSPGPLCPYYDKDATIDSNLWLDGGRFQEVVGFTFAHPTITRVLVEDIIASYQRMNWWP